MKEKRRREGDKGRGDIEREIREEKRRRKGDKGRGDERERGERGIWHNSKYVPV